MGKRSMFALTVHVHTSLSANVQIAFLRYTSAHLISTRSCVHASHCRGRALMAKS